MSSWLFKNETLLYFTGTNGEPTGSRTVMRDGLVGLDLRFRSKYRIQTRHSESSGWNCDTTRSSRHIYDMSERIMWRQLRATEFHTEPEGTTGVRVNPNPLTLTLTHEGVTRVTRVTTRPKQQLLVFHKSCFTGDSHRKQSSDIIKLILWRVSLLSVLQL